MWKTKVQNTSFLASIFTIISQIQHYKNPIKLSEYYQELFWLYIIPKNCLYKIIINSLRWEDR